MKTKHLGLQNEVTKVQSRTKHLLNLWVLDSMSPIVPHRTDFWLMKGAPKVVKSPQSAVARTACSLEYCWLDVIFHSVSQ